MRDRLLTHFIFITLSTLFIALFLSAVVFRSAFDDLCRSDIEQSTILIVTDYEDISTPTRLADFAAIGLHIAIITPEGDVIYDSARDAHSVQLSDPEIRSALLTGHGQSDRPAARDDYTVYYYAIRLQNGSVLRAGKEASWLYTFNSSILPLFALVLIGILIYVGILSSKLTKRLVHPVSSLADNIDRLQDFHAPYPELIPVMEKLEAHQAQKAENERLRQEFAANVTHELKTPLTSISGYAEMIETGIARQEDVVEFASKIRFESSRLLMLIGDIMQLSELDTLNQRENFESTDLYMIAETVGDYLDINAHQKEVTLDIIGSPTLVSGNPAQLEELIYNLCDNAIRYNRPGGRVTCTVDTADGRPRLCVEDTGIGIPQEHHERIFERFYRVDKGRSRRDGGTGLGLAIVKHVALHHGATIKLESQVDGGTRITVLFPPADTSK